MIRKVTAAAWATLLVGSMGCTAIKGMIKTDVKTGGGSASSPVSGGGSSASSGDSGGGSSGGGVEPSNDWDLKAERVLVVQPAPGKPKAPPMKPTWCATADRIPGSTDSSLVRGYLEFNEQTKEWPLSDWPNAAILLCKNPESSTVQQQTGYLVQLYINRWDLTVEEATRLIAVHASWDNKYSDDAKATCKELADNKDGLVASAEAWALADIYGCKGIGSNDGTWALWRMPKHPSPLMRLSLIKSCLHYELEPEKVGGITANWAMTSFLNCAPMFDQLDKKAILAELDKRQAPEWAKMSALESLGDARRHIAVGEELFAKMAKKDKDWKTLRDVGAKRFAAWKAEYAKYEAAFQTAFAIDEAVLSDSKSARKACDAEPLRGVVAKIIKDAKPTTLEAFADVVGQPVPAMLIQRIGACYAAQGREVESLPFYWMAQKSPIGRDGTRTEIAYAMQVALIEIRSDREKALDGVSIQIRTGGGWGGVSPNIDHNLAKVGKVAGKGEGMLVSFAPEMIDVEQCTDWVETRKIDRIDNDGKIRYREICRASKTVKENIAPDALTVPKAYTVGLAPGTFAKMLRLRGESGVPLVVYADRAGKKLLSVCGFELK